MNLLKRLHEYFAFTKNEQKVFLFLSVVFVAGVALKAYKAYIVPQPAGPFDYSVSDSAFAAASLSATNDSSVAQSAAIRKIDVNTATKSELMSLPGIGEAMAERILLYREERGGIKKIDELRKVKGIGEKKFEKLKPYVEVK